MSAAPTRWGDTECSCASASIPASAILGSIVNGSTNAVASFVLPGGATFR